VLLMCALNATLFWGGWLPPVEWAPLYWIPGWLWLFAKILVLLLHLQLGQGDRPALSL
jgi:NADH-quinone oxidoreductase subunit H